MLALFPEGFEEVARDETVELAAYTDAGGERRLRDAFGTVASVAVPQGWEDRWRGFHRPVRLGNLWIGPPWAEAPAGAVAVVIDPGRAFGTGGHPTTQLCLEFIARLEPGSLLDLGCGSGVLAIAAAKLGFTPVTAIDRDHQAVEATVRNAAANRVQIVARDGELAAGELPSARVCVANISLGVVRDLGARVDCELVVTSGYFESEQPDLVGFRRTERRTREGWAADLHARE
jgi:ribosomal protein L11 methyltransferase